MKKQSCNGSYPPGALIFDASKDAAKYSPYNTASAFMKFRFALYSRRMWGSSVPDSAVLRCWRRSAAKVWMAWWVI